YSYFGKNLSGCWSNVLLASAWLYGLCFWDNDNRTLSVVIALWDCVACLCGSQSLFCRSVVWHSTLNLNASNVCGFAFKDSSSSCGSIGSINVVAGDCCYSNRTDNFSRSSRYNLL